MMMMIMVQHGSFVVVMTMIAPPSTPLLCTARTLWFIVDSIIIRLLRSCFSSTMRSLVKRGTTTTTISKAAPLIVFIMTVLENSL